MCESVRSSLENVLSVEATVYRTGAGEVEVDRDSEESTGSVDYEVSSDYVTAADQAYSCCFI